MKQGVRANSHNQPIVVVLIVCFQWTSIHRIRGFLWRERLWKVKKETDLLGQKKKKGTYQPR